MLNQGYVGCGTRNCSGGPTRLLRDGDPLWKAGVGKNIITPIEPTWLSGYEERNKPHEGVLRDLYVKALALQDETGHTAVLVTADILGFTREAGAAVAE